MNTSIIAFYAVLTIYQFLSLGLIVNSEDLKSKKQFEIYQRITIFIGLTGVFMEMVEWNYLKPFYCILLTYSPFITLHVIKGVMLIYKNTFKKEPHFIFNSQLIDGFWVKNKGVLKYKTYYTFYSVSQLIIPVIIMSILLFFAKLVA